MKILYITPRITGEGGLVRVIAMKANYFADVLGYEVHILTQNNNHIDPFYHFSDNIQLHNMNLEGNRIQFLQQYIKSIKAVLSKIKPDVVLVCDGFKGFFIPLFINPPKTALLFESHGSIFNTIKEQKETLVTSLQIKLSNLFKRSMASKFDKFIVLSKESAAEWNVSNSVVIANPNWLYDVKKSNLTNKKAIAIGRHSYEKGIDRLLLVWKKIVATNPEWILEVYGSFESDFYQKMAQEMGLSNSVVFFQPVVNIQEKYQEASLLLMTSRYEGFPMALIEAMTFGLPCVAFDCPCGPSVIIQDNENGLLIKNNDIDQYAEKVSRLIQNQEVMRYMGNNAVHSVTAFDVDAIMAQWNDLLQSLPK